MALFRREPALTPTRLAREPFAMLRQMTSELDRMFEESAFRFPWPEFRALEPMEGVAWLPKIEVLEKNNRLLTKIDLPGMKKEDVKVEVTDGYLAISGERKRAAEEKKDEYFRSEREYGRFYRAVPLPEGVKFDDIKATFTDGVLEVSVPLPVKPEAKVRKVEIGEVPKSAKTAA